MKSIHDIRKIENFHILLWLLKDLCWVSLSKIMGVVMIVPTLAFAVYITWKNRFDKTELLHNLAICSWICANSVWMIGEFYFEDGTRGISMFFFLAGLASMAYYYLIEDLPRRLRKTNKKPNV
ncbi:MAG TPA: hypothetical protein PLU53_11650 [Bacteroidia bacterium]|nr:hypothetical protein [Bacteroidia bacterium]